MKLRINANNDYKKKYKKLQTSHCAYRYKVVDISN